MKKITFYKFFVYCAIFFGTIFIVLTPPFQSPDEDSHFKKAYVIANGDFYPTVEKGVVGFEIPQKMLEYINVQLEYMGNRDQKMKYSEIVIDDRLGVDYGEKVFVNFSTVQSNPIAHIIPAIGILFGKGFHFLFGNDGLSASASNLIYFARFANLIFYTIMGYYTLKMTPVLKKTTCCALLMPMSLFLASSASYDVPLIAVSFLSIAIILKLILDKEYFFNRKQLVILTLLAAFILALKMNYLLIFLLLFFVPKNKFKNNKDFWKNAGVFFVAIVGIYFVYKLPGMFISTGEVANQNGSLISQQTAYVLSNPLQYLKIVCLDLYYGLEFYLTGTVGILGLLDTYILNFVVYMFLTALFVIALSEASLENIKINVSLRIAVIAIFVISLLVIYTVFYITWTPLMPNYGVGAQSVSGVQGRYFIPLIPLVFIMMLNTKLVTYKYIKQAMSLVLDNTCLVSVVVLAITCITLLLRFWV